MDQEENGVIKTGDLRSVLERVGFTLTDNEIYKMISDVFLL